MIPERLTLVRPCGGRFEVGPIALETMWRYLQDEPSKPEAGGVLLGRHISGTSDVIVDQVTTPQREDRQARRRFFRARRRHQQLIDAAWRQSGETCAYLGEWHTHPELIPIPSVIDQLDWRRKLLVDRFAGHLFFVILGTTEIRAWEGRYRSVHLSPLRATP